MQRQFKSKQKQQDDDAELGQHLGALGIVEGDVMDPRVGVGQAGEPVRAERNAGNEEAEHRAYAGAMKQRHDHAGHDQEDDEALEVLGVQHGSASRPGSSHSLCARTAMAPQLRV